MSFQQGLSGLDAAAQSLDVIGNNVANASTVGFKSSTAEFSDVFASAVAGASSGSQVGIGTAVSSVAQQFTQGNITVTNNPLDMAINGQGFFRVDHAGAIAYSRNGQFSLDKNGYIVDSTGSRLTGYTANAAGVVSQASYSDLQISTAEIPASATSTAKVVANLDSRDTTLTDAGFLTTDPTSYQNVTSMSVFDSQGNSHDLSLYFVKTAANSWDVFGSADGTKIAGSGTNGALGTLAFQSD